MTDVLTEVRARLDEHFTAEPISASVTFLGAEAIDVLRYGPAGDGVHRYVSLGCSRHPMVDPTQMLADPTTGPRAEVVVAARADAQQVGPVDRRRRRVARRRGLILRADALIDLETPWRGTFTAMLLGHSDIPDIELPAPRIR